MNGTSVACGVFLVLGMLVAGLVTPTGVAKEPPAPGAPTPLVVELKLATTDPNGVATVLARPKLILLAGAAGTVEIGSEVPGPGGSPLRPGVRLDVTTKTPTADGVALTVDLRQTVIDRVGDAATSRSGSSSHSLDLAWGKTASIGPVALDTAAGRLTLEVTVRRGDEAAPKYGP